MREESEGTQRLESFSDGVMAIVVTIIVFGLKPPSDPGLRSLRAMWPAFATYGASFVFVAIVWLNHHRLLRAAKRIDAYIFWANILMLFPLTLLPFATSYLAENVRAALPVVFYASVFLCCTIGYLVLGMAIDHSLAIAGDHVRMEGRRANWKSAVAIIAYVLAAGLAFVSTWASLMIVLGAACLFIPPPNWVPAPGWRRRANHEGSSGS